MLPQRDAADRVSVSGAAHSVRELVERGFAKARSAIPRKGDGADVRGGAASVKIDPRDFRRAEVSVPFGDPSKAGQKFCWKRPSSFADLVKTMVAPDAAQSGVPRR